MQARTQLPPLPRSAAQARHWVRDHLTGIGRTDLVPAAEAGVSELVTNGILHAQTSIGLQVTGTHDRVVIEVYDGSPTVHQHAGEGAETAVDSTIGRGLRIVRAYAREWGVSTSAHGKAIWFQPAPSGERPEATEGDGDGRATIDLDATLDALAEAFPEPVDTGPTGEETVEVWLRGVPLAVVQHHRKRWLELVREMQLVALGEPSPQQRMAQGFCDAAQTVQPDLYVVECASTSPAVGDVGGAVDAVLEVRPSMREAFVQVRDLARQLEKEWAGIRLLFVHPGRQAVQLREWWLGEIVSQLDGAPSTPWPGEMRVRDEAMLLRGEP